jgi:hypothetical protein
MAKSSVTVHSIVFYTCTQELFWQKTHTMLMMPAAAEQHGILV